MSTETARGSEHGAATGRLTAGTLLKIWGGAVTGGWLVTQGAILTGSTADSLQFGLTAFWLVGSLVPITASFLWMRKTSFTGLFPVWTALGVTGLVASFAVVAGALPVDAALVLGSLWFAGPAVGFLVTAAYMTDWSSRFYAGVAAVNLLGAVAIVAVPGFVAVYAGVAAVVQGLPMLYHGAKLG